MLLNIFPGSHVFISTWNNFLVEVFQHLDQETLCKYPVHHFRKSTSILSSFHIGFLYNKEFEHQEMFNVRLAHLKEVGIYTPPVHSKPAELEVFINKTVDKNCTTSKAQGLEENTHLLEMAYAKCNWPLRSARGLGLVHMSQTFYIYLGGIGLSVVCFFIEIVLHVPLSPTENSPFKQNPNHPKQWLT